MKYIGKNREPFWDDFLLNPAEAEFRVHEPVAREAVLNCDEAWEGDGCDYLSMICDNGLYRLYYLGWRMFDESGTRHTTSGISVCYAESHDGICWVKPNLGLRDTGYNVLLDASDGRFDNFVVFIDDGPAFSPDEKYKATASHYENGRTVLWCYTSPDGFVWRKNRPITDRGMFDSQNIAFFDKISGQYVCYLRDFHVKTQTNGKYVDIRDSGEDEKTEAVRDIRRITSPDFINWSEPESLDFGNLCDTALYTSCIQPYERTPQLLVGFPSRYVERPVWTPAFDGLAGAAKRRERADIHPRYGLTTTDCVFMCSRDGLRWYRHDTAFMRPGIEREYNWVYGDCYPAVGMALTKSSLPHAPDELSFYCFEKHWSGEPTLYRRYTLRRDGFVSLHADNAVKTYKTGEFVFEGSKMELNFSTSALGFVFVRLFCGSRELCSCELFGDSLEKTVPFLEGTGELSGRPVRAEFTMSDADIYTMRFCD